MKFSQGSNEENIQDTNSNNSSLSTTEIWFNVFEKKN